MIGKSSEELITEELKAIRDWGFQFILYVFTVGNKSHISLLKEILTRWQRWYKDIE